MIRSAGLPLLGLLPDGREIGFPGDSHLLTTARAGAGKNRCVILPNLIRHPGSVLVLDPKGENATITAKWRAEKLGQPVYVFDPFHVVADEDLPASGRASFDPVAFVAQSMSPFSAAQQVADALIIPGDKDTHWADAARLVIAATLLFVATSPVIARDDLWVDVLGQRLTRTMRTVWSIIADDRYTNLQMFMVESTDPFISKQGSVLSGLRIVQETVEGEDGKPFTRAAFGKVLNGKENESKLSTLMTQCLGTFSEPGIMNTLEGKSVDFGSLSRVPSSVYIVLPGSLASVHARFMRLLIRCALAEIENAGLDYPMPDGSRRPSTLFILDEFATLGCFPAIPEAMGRMRGYGLKFWTFVQTLSQLKKHYGETWTEIPGNAGVVQYFGGTNDPFTAEYISKRTGEKTAGKTGRSSSTAPASGVSTSESVYGRPVLFPGEVASLPDGVQLLLFLGLNGPVKAGLMYRDKPDHFGDFMMWDRNRRRRPAA